MHHAAPRLAPDREQRPAEHHLHRHADDLLAPAQRHSLATYVSSNYFSLLGAAPPLIIYAFLMDYYIAGLTAGATKG